MPHYLTHFERINLIVPGETNETIDYALEHWIQTAKSALAKRGAFYVALSGGSTPQAIYKKLSEHYAREIEWKNVHLFWSDERAVPPDSAESNYKMAMDAGLSQLGIPTKQIHRMPAETSDATRYAASIKKTLGDQPFDLIMLGMGEDGHTASLFPDTQALSQREETVVMNHIPQKQTDRMTMTLPLINQAREAVFYVLGESKADMLYTILIENAPLPANKVGTEEHKALWIADQAAAQKVMLALS